MMKTFIYIISLVLALAVLGLFVIKQPNGEPWLSIDAFSPGTIDIKEKVNLVTGKLNNVYKNITSQESDDIKVYRWKDADGNWSYSDKPNEMSNSQELILNPDDVMVLPSFDASTINQPESKTDKSKVKASPSNESNSPSKVLDVFKEANNVQKIMDDRQQTLSKAIEESSG